MALQKDDTEAELAALATAARDMASDGSIAVFDKVRGLMARLFAYWTLERAEHYKAAGSGTSMLDEETRKMYLFQPHAAQAVSIFRLFGFDAVTKEKRARPRDAPPPHPAEPVLEKMDNHLVEVLTGEGKSITLGVTAAVLALLGLHVDCACYSKCVFLVLARTVVRLTAAPPNIS